MTRAQRHHARLHRGGSGLPPIVQEDGLILEILYQIHVMHGMTLAPDLQYYVNPNAQKSLPDQLMLGVKTQIEFI